MPGGGCERHDGLRARPDRPRPRDFEERWHRRRGGSGPPGHEEHQAAARGSGLVAPAHLQDHDIHHRPTLSRSRLSCGRRASQRRVSGLDRTRGLGAGPAGMAGRGRRDSCHSGLRHNMTFSIAARCARTGMLGIAVSSSSPAVAARCAYARAGVGAVGSQNITDPTLGPRLLDLIALGATAAEAVRIVAGSAAHITFRQLVAVDAGGRTGVFSGSKTLGTYAAAEGDGAAAAGNMLRSKLVPDRMLSAFLGSTGALGGRLLGAMRAGLAAGGEEGPVHSSGLLIVRDVPWPVANLRVDWSDADPIADLERLWAVYEPQLEGYVTRALDPSAAPNFGVPGDE